AFAGLGGFGIPTVGRSPVPSASLSVVGSSGRSEIVSELSLGPIFGSARPWCLGIPAMVSSYGVVFPSKQHPFPLLLRGNLLGFGESSRKRRPQGRTTFLSRWVRRFPPS